MGLLTSATSANRVEDTDLGVTYARRRIYGLWTVVMLNVTTTYYFAWEYVRRAVKSYRYVGLDESTAKSLAATLRNYYTRATKVSEFDTTQGSGTYGQFTHVAAGDVPMADVVAQHENAGMWSVTVSVNEEDVRLSLSPSESFAQLFHDENLRGYDDGATAPTQGGVS